MKMKNCTSYFTLTNVQCHEGNAKNHKNTTPKPHFSDASIIGKQCQKENMTARRHSVEIKLAVEEHSLKSIPNTKQMGFADSNRDKSND